jgi:cholinesterase
MVFDMKLIGALSYLCVSVLARPQGLLLPWNIGQTVKTTSGQIEGHASSLKPEVSEYLGIPFAKPPIDELRFAAPQKFQGNGTFKAAAYSPDCPAPVGSSPSSQLSYVSVLATVAGIWGQAGRTQSEDCLTLNVWSKPQVGEKKKAVMAWIYGGGEQLDYVQEQSNLV